MMRKVISVSVCAAVLSAVCSFNQVILAAQTPAAQAPATVTATTTTGTVQGSATEANRPVAGAGVRLTSTGTPAVVLNATTSATGTFTFTGVTPGAYSLSLLRDGRVIGTGANIQVRANQTTQATVAAGGPVAAPEKGFNMKKFAIISALIAAVLTVVVVQASK